MNSDKIRQFRKGCLIVMIILFALAGVASGATLGAQTPSSPHTSNYGDTFKFSAKVTAPPNETVVGTWTVDGVIVDVSPTVGNGDFIEYSPNSTYTEYSKTYTVTLDITNNTGSPMQWIWTVVGTPPSITNYTPATPVSLSQPATQTFQVMANQTVDVTWKIDGTLKETDTNVAANTYAEYTLNDGTLSGNHTLTATATSVKGNGSVSTSWALNISPAPDPILSNKQPSSNPTTVQDEDIVFSIDVDQTVDVTWKVDGSTEQTNSSVSGTVQFRPTDYISEIGNWTVDVEVENTTTGRSATESWLWKVEDRTTYGGNTIWEEGTASTTYTWDAHSFGWFYYDIDEDVGSETIKFTNIDATGRSVAKGNIEYTTSRALVDYDYGSWGQYYVIGFLANKYFAGYQANNPAEIDHSVNVLSKGQLHRVLMDTDKKYSVYAGASLELEEGYELVVREIDLDGGRVYLELTKDGEVIDSDFIASGDTYIYKKDAGSVDDLPIILARVGAVFRGVETNAVFIQGLFQISEDYDDVKTGDNYGMMEVTTVSSTTLTMKNDETLSLSRGEETTLMGDIKVIVADSDTVRFKLSVDRETDEPVRGAIATGIYTWTPFNFEAFYYDLDNGVGSEKLEVQQLSGRTIPDGKLVYTTSRALVDYDYGSWGQYYVIGFLANKYFAGYQANNPA
ncbi:MAG: S-layer protein domain-containing protein, partial [Methermicoccaceae archaeon]